VSYIYLTASEFKAFEKGEDIFTFAQGLSKVWIQNANYGFHIP
jgi:hypothetical protein